MGIETILEMTKDWDEEQIRTLMLKLNLRRDKVTRIWDYVFGCVPTFYQRDRTTKWINEFGYDKTRLGFQAAGDSGVNEKQSIRYIDKVIRNLHQEEAIKKEKEEAFKKSKDIALVSGENIRAKPDIKDNGWKAGLLTNGLKEENLLKEILNAKEIGE